MSKNVWNPCPMTEELLIAKGEKWRKWGIRLLLIGLCGLALFIVTLLITLLFFGGEDILYVLALNADIFIANIFTLIGYLSVPCLSVSTVLYLQGLHFWALGKIALNTKKNSETQE